MAEPNWWTWRALWALTQVYPTLVKTDNALAQRTRETIFATIDVIYKDFNFKQTRGEKRAWRCQSGCPIPLVTKPLYC